MATESEILDAYGRAQVVYSDMVAHWLQEYADGCKCDMDNINQMFSIIKAMKFLIDLGKVLGTEMQKLYKCLIKLIGGTGGVQNPVVYFGWKNSKTTLTQEEIVASSRHIEITSGNNYNVDFSPNADYLFLWFAEPSSQPVKVKWEDINLAINNGDIGTDQDLFGAPIIVGSYRFYITEYSTKSVNPFRFTKQ